MTVFNFIIFCFHLILSCGLEGCVKVKCHPLSATPLPCPPKKRKEKSSCIVEPFKKRQSTFFFNIFKGIASLILALSISEKILMQFRFLFFSILPASFFKPDSFGSLSFALSHLVKAMVFPVVIYGCESWTVKKAEC